jgi:AcrR family transcriptional regulator
VPADKANAAALRSTRRGNRGPAPRAVRNRLRTHSGDTPAELTILAATDELLATTGLHDLSVTQITDAAGVSRPTFYFYFATKYAVVATLLERVFEDISDAIQPWLEREPGTDPVPKLRASLRAGVRLWSSNHAIRSAHEHWHSAPELQEVWLGIVENFRQTLADEIQRVRTGENAVAGMDPELLSSTLMWASERILYISARKVDPRLDTPEAAVEGLLAIWLPSIYGLPYAEP